MRCLAASQKREPPLSLPAFFEPYFDRRIDVFDSSSVESIWSWMHYQHCRHQSATIIHGLSVQGDVALFNEQHSYKSKLEILCLSEDCTSDASLKTALATIGYADVILTSSPEDAISHLAHKRFDLFIADIGSHEIGGLELVRQIRNGETAAPHDVTTLILATEERLSATSINLGDLGINGILMTPFSLNMLDEQIAYAVSHHHLAQLANPNPIEQGDVIPNHPKVSHNPEQTFTLAFGAIGEGMYLVKPIRAHGNVLIAAGVCLDESHLMLLEQMEHVLDGDEAALSFVCPYDCDSVSETLQKELSAPLQRPLLDFEQTKSGRVESFGFGFG